MDNSFWKGLWACRKADYVLLIMRTMMMIMIMMTMMTIIIIIIIIIFIYCSWVVTRWQ